jgi:hypothetical protein
MADTRIARLATALDHVDKAQNNPGPGLRVWTQTGEMSALRDLAAAVRAFLEAPALTACVPESAVPDGIRAAMTDVISYCWASEKRDLAENGGEALQPEHIFLKLRLLRQFLETGAKRRSWVLSCTPEYRAAKERRDRS